MIAVVKVLNFYLIRILVSLYRGLMLFSPLALIWMLKGMTIDPLFKKISWRQLPKVAGKLSLKCKQSRDYSKFGELSGKIQKHKVLVTPDDNKKLIVFFKSKYQIDISTYKSNYRPTSDEPDFNTQNWKFNKIFKTRRANIELSDSIDKYPELTNYLVSFYMRWIWHLDFICIEESHISCAFNYGAPFHLYLPANVLQKILPELIVLAQQIDSVFMDSK